MPVTAKPRPWLAAILSLAAIGTGQLYTGAWLDAFMLMVSAWSLIGLGFAALPAGSAGFVVMLVLMILSLSMVVLSAVDAFRRARAWAPDSPRPAYSRWPVLTVVVLASWTGATILREHVVEDARQALRNPSSSMAPTILAGDYLMADKSPTARQLRRGVVYIHQAMEEPTVLVVKRAVAIGGDTVAMRSGTLYVNGSEVVEPYLSVTPYDQPLSDSLRAGMRRWQLGALVGRDTAGYAPDQRDWGPLLVPSGHFMALGDNRARSYDSRFTGFIPDSLVRGIPTFVYFSRDSLGAIQWHRLGMDPSGMQLPAMKPEKP